MRNCLTGSAPQYLKAYCIPVSSIPSRSTLRSSARGHLVVPRTRTSMTQSRSFAIVGPSNWNKLPQSLRDLFPISSDQFRKHLKTSLFVSKDTDPSRERLWFKWRYINAAIISGARVGAPLSSFLEKTLYKCSIWILNEYSFYRIT